MGILRRLKSDPPSHILAPWIAELLEKTDTDISADTVISLADDIQVNLKEGFRKLLIHDRKITGVGLHNVNRVDGEWATGAYRVEFRPIFRPIQYVYSDLGDDDLVWRARNIVKWSCSHVEDALKYRFKVPENFNASLGVLLTRKSKKSGMNEIKENLDPHFYQWILALNKGVYRASKHSIEKVKLDSHLFAPADALAVYLMCRWAGAHILEKTGLFDNWEADQ